MITCPRCKGKRETHGIACGPGGCQTGAMKCFTCKGEGQITEEHAARITTGEFMRKGRVSRRVTLREEAARLGVGLAEWSHIEQGDEPETEAGRVAYRVRVLELEIERDAEEAKVAEAERHGVKCWCGRPMTPIGQGAYPYDCPAKIQHPDDMIYMAKECGHHGWTHRAVTI